MTEPTPTSILLVDDERSLREPLAEYLVRQGFAVREAESAAQARTLLAQESPDLALLDIMMPGEDGLSLCRHLVESRGLPTILLTAKGEAMDRIIGLEIGADDYVTKPFSPRELVLRIKNLLRLTEKSPDGVKIIEAGPFRLDTVRHQATADGKSLNITATEFKLLCLLASRPGEVQPRETLLRDVWGYEPTLDTRTVDTTMQRLRAKLGQAAHHLETVRGVGYRLTDLNA